ncbi:hypothetical protein Dsin_031942 [Dipteronia sinensis]|uniref:HAUS augmin-like complex subunit 3 N-terminal domain-containing protein n=1 Tax=Dipteronia sinensis TaxID=43782 RepID=A0AAD9ZLZ4_9ROSI|nr:hypothetical protein Dsin_031942 [Dipteronia sinensis]
MEWKTTMTFLVAQRIRLRRRADTVRVAVSIRRRVTYSLTGYATLPGEDLEFAYDSTSAFSSRTNIQDAVFGYTVREATLAYKAEAAELQRQLRHLQSQFDRLASQASA